MIRWRYKTLHFELKKDGILGGLFLDEEELERILCRHGQDGWELVTVLDVQNGLVALCKQAVAEKNLVKAEPIATSRQEEENGAAAPAEPPPVQPNSGFRGIAHLVSDVKTEAPGKPAAKPPVINPPPKPARSADLFGELDEEDEAPSHGPRVDAAGDEEGSGLSKIKIE